MSEHVGAMSQTWGRKIISNSLDDFRLSELFQKSISGFMAAAALFQRVVEHQFGVPKPAVARATYDIILGQCLRFEASHHNLNINLHQLKRCKNKNAVAKQCNKSIGCLITVELTRQCVNAIKNAMCSRLSLTSGEYPSASRVEVAPLTVELSMNLPSADHSSHGIP